jgi:TatD DNase family protein
VIDTHAHLSLMAERGEDLAVFFSAWSRSGGGLIVDVGVRPGDLASRRARVEEALTRAFPGLETARPPVAFTVGAWPGAESLADIDESLALMRRDFAYAAAPSAPLSLDRAPLIAIGEVGLDYHWMEAPSSRQIELFEACAALAKESGLPLIIHSREAEADTIEAVKRSGLGDRALIHCFSYGVDAARAFLDSGAYISFSGSVTYKKADALREAALMIPADRILAETDAPYMTPGKDRGKRSSTPLDVAATTAFLAGIRGVQPERFAAEVERNAERLFGLNGPRR